MDNREIKYDMLLSNVNDMIKLLEFDAMRSAGKAKLNAGSLHDLYQIKDRYEGFIKEAGTKEVPEIPQRKPNAKTK